jgi:hypothetical protein
MRPEARLTIITIIAIVVLAVIAYVVLYIARLWKDDQPDNLTESTQLAGAAAEAVIAKIPAGANPTKCPDEKLPYWDPTYNKCVECLESSFLCLTGYQRCYRGTCVVKNSPQCSYYPIGAVGGAVVVTAVDVKE